MKKTFTLIAGGMLLAGAVKAQLPNVDMESWRSYTVSSVAMEGPTGWHCSDSVLGNYAIITGGAKKQVYKSTDKHNGTFAACLVAKSYGALGVVPGVITNADISLNIATQSYTSSGGTPVTQRVTSASAWLKFLPKGTDTATFGVSAVIAGMGAGGADSVIGAGSVKLVGTSTGYTQITVPVTYVNATQIPTHIQIGFISCSVRSGVDSSVLLVDDVSMVTASGVSRVLVNADVVKVYPNPASGTLFLSSKEPEKLTWEAVAANGQIIATKEFTQNGEVSLAGIASGMYFFRVMNADNQLVQTGKFIVK